MKKLVLLLSFAFAMFFANSTFANPTNNNLADKKAEIVLTENNQGLDVPDSITSEDVHIKITVHISSDGKVTVTVTITIK